MSPLLHVRIVQLVAWVVLVQEMRQNNTPRFPCFWTNFFQNLVDCNRNKITEIAGIFIRLKCLKKIGDACLGPLG